MTTDIIKSSKTFAEAIKKIYGYDNGKTRKKFLIFVSQNKIDITHLQKKYSKYVEIIKNCPVCGVEFKTVINNKNEKTTCSYSCSNTFFRSGKNNPNWKDEKYQTTCWFHHKKECVVCAESLVVAVHHYDENHNNNSPENLVPLCPTHHHYVHSKHKHLVIDKINEYVYNFTKNI
jgi:hypothetical protein